MKKQIAVSWLPGTDGVFVRSTLLLAAVLLVLASAGHAQQVLDKSTVVIGTEVDYPPYSFMGDDGRPTGFNVELTQAIAEVMGLDVEIRIGPWSEIRDALETGRIDAIVGMYYSPERDKLVDFSPAFTIIHHAIFARSDSPKLTTEEDLHGKEIIVMRGDIMHDYVLEQDLTQNPFVVGSSLKIEVRRSDLASDLATTSFIAVSERIGANTVRRTSAKGRRKRFAMKGYTISPGIEEIISWRNLSFT